MLIKPSWHSGTWTAAHQKMLIKELKDAEKIRSLTNEEKEWIHSLLSMNEEY